VCEKKTRGQNIEVGEKTFRGGESFPCTWSKKDDKERHWGCLNKIRGKTLRPVRGGNFGFFGEQTSEMPCRAGESLPSLSKREGRIMKENPSGGPPRSLKFVRGGQSKN